MAARLLQALQNLDEGSSEPALLFSSLIPTVIKPIMSPSVEEDVSNALSQFMRRDLWKKWGLAELRPQGPAFLLKGPPGTGKTSIARWIARQVGNGFIQMDVSSMACEGAPGEYERGIKAFFADCKRRKYATIFMDECDHMLIDRSTIGEAGKTWQLGGIETLMMEMNVYKGLILCATNHPESLDPALSDRFLAIIEVDKPDYEMRKRLWKQKIPKSFPLRPNDLEIAMLAKVELTGRQIESVILNAAQNAIRVHKNPTLSMLQLYAERQKEQHLG